VIFGGNAEDTQRVIRITEPAAGPYCRFFECAALDAEIIKYMENTFLAVKVAFVNEFYELCKTVGANWNSVREGWLLDERIGRSHSLCFENERGFGGKCLPKDTLAISAFMHSAGLNPMVTDAVIEYNKTLRPEEYK